MILCLFNGRVGQISCNCPGVKAGLESAKRKGRRGGRPKALTDEKKKKLKSLLETNKFSVSQICEMAKISRSVYYRSLPNE